MRFWVFAAALMCAPAALAQEAPHINGFRIGMNVEDARAVAPDLTWRPNETRAHFSVTQRTHRFGDVAAPLSLIFVNGALDYIGGGAYAPVASADECVGRLRTIVTALEQTTGPLRDAEAYRTGAVSSEQTDGGSIIQRLDNEQGVNAIASAHAPLLIEVRAWMNAQSRDGVFQCMIMYDFSADALPPADLPRSSVEDIVWLNRPTGSDFARYYPFAAVDVSRPGYAILMCNVIADGALSCTIGHESPRYWGFGDAAMRISRSFRIAPVTLNNVSTEGATIRLPIRFRPSF